jgi:hypothetical protein
MAPIGQENAAEWKQRAELGRPNSRVAGTYFILDKRKLTRLGSFQKLNICVS